jgi:hypothetical protein
MSPKFQKAKPTDKCPLCFSTHGEHENKPGTGCPSKGFPKAEKIQKAKEKAGLK